MNPDKIAVDIILLPSPEITEIALKINRKLLESTKDSSIVLDKKTCIPHVSLAMGGIEISDIDSLSEELEIIANRYLPYEAGYKGYACVKTSENQNVSGIDLIKDDTLANLQDDIISAFSRYNLKSVTPDMVFPDSRKITDFTLNYSAGYTDNSTGDHFSPHITLGHGSVFDLKNIPVVPQRTVCTKLAVCHLGNHCTCRKIIFESS